MTTSELSRQLRYLVAQGSAQLTQQSATLASRHMAPGKWTLLELLGHLIDSAANNHQRILRASYQDELVWPGYPQEDQVRAQRYNEAPPQQLIALWAALNTHIAWVVDGVPEAKLGTRCVVGGEESTLGSLIEHYVSHMEHHLRQLLGSGAMSWSGLPWPPK